MFDTRPIVQRVSCLPFLEVDLDDLPEFIPRGLWPFIFFVVNMYPLENQHDNPTGSMGLVYLSTCSIKNQPFMQLNIPYMDPMGMETQPIWRCISLFDVVIFQPVMWILRDVSTLDVGTPPFKEWWLDFQGLYTLIVDWQCREALLTSRWFFRNPFITTKKLAFSSGDLTVRCRRSRVTGNGCELTSICDISSGRSNDGEESVRQPRAKTKIRQYSWLGDDAGPCYGKHSEDLTYSPPPANVPSPPQKKKEAGPLWQCTFLMGKKEALLSIGFPLRPAIKPVLLKRCEG